MNRQNMAYEAPVLRHTARSCWEWGCLQYIDPQVTVRLVWETSGKPLDCSQKPHWERSSSEVAGQLR